MAAMANLFTLPAVDGPEVRLADAVGDGPAVLVFVHADCPTSLLALRRLPAETPQPVVVIAQDTLPEAARLARRARVPAPVLADAPPYAVSRDWEVSTVPTAVRVEPGGTPGRRVEGWDREALAGLLGVPLSAEPPEHKPGCGSRWTYEEQAGGLDELEDMFERGWSDGLPVVPPTPERVEAMLGGRDPGRSLGAVPPVGGEATLERIAACAVLAGCRPEHFALVEAAVDAALDPAFNVHGINVTTQPAAPIVIVNGPARERAGLNAGMGALGPGTRGNATVGRALRLCLSLTGGAVPGGLDRSTLGHPGKVGLCIAENEEASPWPPLHVERGFAADTSTVTVLACDAPLSVSDHRSRSAEELALVLARAAEATWSPFWWPMDDDSLFVICPEHAALFAASGWNKQRLRTAIFEAAVRPAGELRRGETTPRVRESDDEEPIHKWTSRDRILIVCAGGEAGRYSAVLGPCDGMGTRPVTREVRWST
jgi:AhpC/TSA family